MPRSLLDTEPLTSRDLDTVRNVCPHECNCKLLIVFKAFLDMIIGPFRLNFYFIYAEDTETIKIFSL